jgi:hypothetical protein
MFLGDTKPSLLFGGHPPIPNGLFRPRNSSASEVADQVLSVLEPCIADIYRLSDPEAFLDYLRNLSSRGYGADRNPLWFWGFCLTLIATNRINEARENLVKLSVHENFLKMKSLPERFSRLQFAMASGCGSEVALLAEWEADFRNACGLKS